MSQPKHAITLTQQKLIDELSGALELPRKEAQAVLETILASMARAIVAGEKVEIRGFGRFSTRQRAAR